MPGVTEGKGQPEWDLGSPCEELTTAPCLPCPSQDLLIGWLGPFGPQPGLGTSQRFSLLKYSTSPQVSVTVSTQRWKSEGSKSLDLHSWLSQAVCTQPRTCVCDTPFRACSFSGPHRAFLGSSSQNLPVLATWPTRTLPLTSRWTSSSCEQFWGPSSQLCYCPPLITQGGSCSTQAAKSRGCAVTGCVLASCPSIKAHRGRWAHTQVQPLPAGGEETGSSEKGPRQNCCWG